MKNINNKPKKVDVFYLFLCSYKGNCNYYFESSTMSDMEKRKSVIVVTLSKENEFIQKRLTPMTGINTM